MLRSSAWLIHSRSDSLAETYYINVHSRSDILGSAAAEDAVGFEDCVDLGAVYAEAVDGTYYINVHGGAAEHAVGSEDCVDLGAVYAEAVASEPALGSGDWCLHRCGGCQRTQIPWRSDSPCGLRAVSGCMRLARTIDSATPLQCL